MNGETILRVARKYDNLTEILANQKWDDLSKPGVEPVARELIAKLTSAGWTPTWAYCMAWVEVVWKEAYEEDKVKKARIMQLINPSVMKSYRLCSDAGLIEKLPRPGAIMFMQKGTSGFGHAGIVESVKQKESITLIEANTSRTPVNGVLDREGDGIYSGKVRSLKFQPSKNLWIRGFLNPI